MSMSDFVHTMKHSPIHNYGGIPGLTSWLLGAPSKQGLVRLMECSRAHQEPIIPHSHRFDFSCTVLEGRVQNLIWEPTKVGGDEFCVSELIYGGAIGEYEKVYSHVERFDMRRYTYVGGDEYGMSADQVHSIFFDRGTVVLFFEGPMVSDRSIILEPLVDGAVVPTFKVEPWMFKKGDPA